MKRFAESLRRLLSERGISQTILAEHLEISRQSVSQYVSDKAEPSLDNLVKIARFLGVSTDELLGMKHVVKVKKKSRSDGANIESGKTIYDGAIVAHNGGFFNEGNKN